MQFALLLPSDTSWSTAVGCPRCVTGAKELPVWPGSVWWQWGCLSVRAVAQPVEDFAEITCLDTGDADNSPENQSALIEIGEYVRE